MQIAKVENHGKVKRYIHNNKGHFILTWRRYTMLHCFTTSNVCNKEFNLTKTKKEHIANGA